MTDPAWAASDRETAGLRDGPDGRARVAERLAADVAR
jgi:hypothetical protein